MANVVAQIKRLQKRIGDLTTYVNNCIKQLTVLRGKKSQLERRLRELDEIKTQATSKLNSYSDDAHDVQAKLKKALRGAVSKHGHTGELESQVNGDMESTFSSDSNGWESVANIDREIARVQQELDETKRQIKNGENNVKNARNNIKTCNTSIKNLQKQQSNG